ncbi:MAG: LacI family transcriptional regulator [Ruminococcus flavefaciens]|nr:LacI family transcriptional regulator [Ruminococcus flavefaciens]
MVTLKEVAQRAGVSITTASIVANGRGNEKRISPETVQRVLEIMEELHYRPNHVARQLRGQAARHTTIGFYWPLDYRTNMLGMRLSNMYSVLMDLGIDYEIVVNTYLNEHIEDSTAPIFSGRYDGVIIGAASDRDLAQLENMEIKIPVILLNRESRKYSTIGVNSAHMGMQMAAMIQRKGLSSCAVVKTRERYVGASGRTKAFLHACQQLGIKVRPEWIFTGSATITGGVHATQELLALTQRPSMVYYESDCMAQGGAYILQKAGLRIPEDVQLLAVGTQVSETMEYLRPSISCISLPPNLDKQAMSTMVRILREGIEEPIRVELEPLVQLRESFL